MIQSNNLRWNTPSFLYRNVPNSRVLALTILSLSFYIHTVQASSESTQFNEGSAFNEIKRHLEGLSIESQK